jgi:seryl-tRNA synthetase
LAGIRERLKVIEKYKQASSNVERTDKLDQMYIELMIELSGLEAKKKATEALSGKEQAFLSLYTKLSSLRGEVKDLYATINQKETSLKEVNKWLKNPPPEMLPPKVFQNAVTIYSIR